MSDWVYPDYFKTLTDVANWVSLFSVLCCVFLLISWAFLPVEKTNRHYLSICLTVAVLLMNVSFAGFKLPRRAAPTMLTWNSSLASWFLLLRDQSNVTTKLLPTA